MATFYDELGYQVGGDESVLVGPSSLPGGSPGKRTLTASLFAARRGASPPAAPTFGTPQAAEPFWFLATPEKNASAGAAGGAADGPPGVAGPPGAATTGLIVEDGGAVGPGQMSKHAFLEAAAPLMPGENLETWSARPAGEIEAAVRKQVTGAAGAKSAQGYLDAIRGQAQAAQAAQGADGAGAGAFAAVDYAGMSEDAARDHVRSGQLGAGAPLAASTRAAMEVAYGQGFGDVRVHTDERASSMASGLGARAFTVGNQIAFAAGNYAPGSAVGDALLAHELAHVAQQRGGSSTGASSQAHEADADHAAAQAVSAMYAGEMSAGPTVTPALKAGVGVQRCPGGGSAPAASALTFTSSSFSPGAGGAVTASARPTQMAIQSAPFSSTGSVAVAGGTDADAQGWDVGYLQTVRSSRRTGHYTGSPANTKFEVTLPANTRDGNPAGGAPWYDDANPSAKKAVSKTGVTETVALWDQPGMGFAWDTPDGLGKLASVDGKDQFAAWVVVRKRASPNTIQFINWETWEVNWAATSTYASAGTKTATATGATASGGSGPGQGGNSPNLTGGVANTVATVGWS